MHKRLIIFGAVLTFILTSSGARCLYISMSKSYSVAESYNSKAYDICKLYPTIYDRNSIRLNNTASSLYAVIKPDEQNMSELGKLFNSANVKSITNELSTGDIVIRPIDKYAKVKHIRLVEATNENSENMLCRHLLNREYGGIESVLDYDNAAVTVNYSVDALGRILRGDDGTVRITQSKNSTRISIDSEIQQIAEASAENMKKGAIVIIDISTSQLLAAYSKGDDYINRATSAYAVGSVFKLVVSACAIENNITPDYTCTNSITVGDTNFHCQNKKSHGKQTMRDALANSCNCYFINLALTLGRERIYETARDFGFMTDLEPYKNYTVKAGAFATLDTLSSDGQLALIGFGQGVLTDTPLHFASVISTIANGGIYKPPTLTLTTSTGLHVISKSTAATLREYMHFVVTDGTAQNANYKNDTAGKTATAQSGIYDNGREVLNTWFAGFYPYSNPRYAIVIMCEDGSSGSVDCCPVFSTIVEKLENL